MIQTASIDQARADRHLYTLPNKTEVWINTFIGTNLVSRRARGLTAEPDAAALYPMAYLVDQAPNSTIKAHYHRADQFQVFISGSGAFEGKPVSAITAHFASAYSPYGPIVSGPEGVSYFTFRKVWDSGARWMPDHRDELRAAARPHRGAVGPSQSPLSAADLAALPEISSVALVGPEPDGLAIWVYRIPPRAALTGPAPSDGEGQFWLMAGGNGIVGATALDSLSCLFLSPDEPACRVTAGDGGAELVVAQFPHGA
jgi:hypothetical protein